MGACISMMGTVRLSMMGRVTLHEYIWKLRFGEPDKVVTIDFHMIRFLKHQLVKG